MSSSFFFFFCVFALRFSFCLSLYICHFLSLRVFLPSISFSRTVLALSLSLSISHSTLFSLYLISLSIYISSIYLSVYVSMYLSICFHLYLAHSLLFSFPFSLILFIYNLHCHSSVQKNGSISTTLRISKRIRHE